ncbi:FHA domain-containing protein, partial [Myxococcota bacterium]|nr:FHA domain-containing protein [Myxococcota bacterium]
MAFQRKIQGEAALKTIFVDDRPTARRLRKSQLVVLEGPEQGQALTIATEEVLVGRSAICDLTLTDASVSSRHFKIIAVDRGYIIQDLGSTNGTF